MFNGKEFPALPLRMNKVASRTIVVSISVALVAGCQTKVTTGQASEVPLQQSSNIRQLSLGAIETPSSVVEWQTPFFALTGPSPALGKVDGAFENLPINGFSLTNATWSRDGRAVAVTGKSVGDTTTSYPSNAASALYIRTASSSEYRKVDGLAGDLRAFLSPSGTSLAVASQKSLGSFEFSYGDVNGNNWIDISEFNSRAGGTGDLTWSNSDIHITRLIPGEAIQIYSLKDKKAKEIVSSATSMLGMTADDKAVMTYRNTANPVLMRDELEGGNHIEIPITLPPGATGELRYIALSPDRTKLAFTLYGRAPLGVYVCSVADGAARLAGPPSHLTGWMPDNKSLIVSVNPEAGKFQYYHLVI